MSEPLLTFCACIDPRRLNPATGHYPGCPDEIIPPDHLLPPWNVVTTEERVYAGRAARTSAGEGRAIFEKVVRHQLVPPRVPVSAPATAPSAPAPLLASPSVSPSSSTVLVLDTETTGLTDPRVCEIALAVVDLSRITPKVIAHASKLVNPGKPIEPSAARVHGITDADVKDSPSLATVWPKLLGWVGKHVAQLADAHLDVIAHNASYDRKALELTLPLLPDEFPAWRWFCSLQASKRIFPDLPSHSLHDDRFKGKRGLSSTLGLTKGESHRALGDVRTTVSLLGKLCEKAGPWSAWRGEMQAGWGSARVFTAKVGKVPHKAAPETPASALAEPAAVSPSPATVQSAPAPSVALPAPPSTARKSVRKPAPVQSLDLFASLNRRPA